MRDRQREGVCGVILRYLRQVEQGLDHLLDLIFLRPAGADNRQFDAARLVLINRQPHARALRDDRAARMRENQHGLDVLGVKNPLNGHRLRLMRPDQLLDLVLQMQQARRQRPPRRVLHRAVIDRNQTRSRAVQHAHAGRAQRGVDAENAEGRG